MWTTKRNQVSSAAGSESRSIKSGPEPASNPEKLTSSARETEDKDGGTHSARARDHYRWMGEKGERGEGRGLGGRGD